MRILHQVSFRPPFYTCSTCTPPTVSSSFTKESKSWYDDDAINAGGQNAIPDDQYDDHDDAYYGANNDDGNVESNDDVDDTDEGNTNDNYWSNWGAGVNNDYFKENDDGDDGGRLLYDVGSSAKRTTMTLQVRISNVLCCVFTIHVVNRAGLLTLFYVLHYLCATNYRNRTKRLRTMHED